MPRNFDLPFVLSAFGAFITCVVVANLYAWPALRALPRVKALRVLASLQAFRFLGLNFVAVGFVSSGLNSSVGNQIAWGDLIAAVLALLSIPTLTGRSPYAIPIVWLSNLWGTADLVNAYYKGVTQVADVGLFGARNLRSSTLCSDTAHCARARVQVALETQRHESEERKFACVRGCQLDSVRALRQQ